MTKYPLVICILFASSAAIAQSNPLIGVWDGTDTAAMALYGHLNISKKTIAWPRTNNLAKCQTRYRVIAQSQGKTYADQLDAFKTDDAVTTYNTIKIKLTPKKCTGRIGYLQFALPINEPDYAEVIEYDRAGKPNGWIHFQKRK